MKRKPCVRAICLVSSLFFIFVAAAMARYLTCDPQPEIVTKYEVMLNAEVFPAEIEAVEGNQVRLHYNVDHLGNGKYSAFARAGNDAGELSDWSEEFVFYSGVPTPQNIGLYCVTEEPGRISQEGWQVVYVSSEEEEHGHFGKLAIDGNVDTQWHSTWTTAHPHEIQIDLGKTYRISGFFYLPRQDTNWNGTIKKYIFYVSMNGVDWTKASEGELSKVKREHLVNFPAQDARYVSLVALSEINGGAWTTVAELNILGYRL